MAFDVHLHVCFECNDNGPVAALARKHWETVKEPIEARWFLDELAMRTGKPFGPKGGLSLWGIVGNYTSGERFCESLRAFWLDLLTIDDYPSGHHVIVFEEREQSEAAIAYEIMLEGDEREKLIIKKHERLPFAWMQF